MNSETIKKQFPDWQELKPGSWSKHNIILYYGSGWAYVEIGLYREPDGKYTLQVFDGEECFLSKTVE